MAYKTNFHEVEMSRQEVDRVLKAHATDEHKPDLDGCPAAKSDNQMKVQYKDRNGQIVEPVFVTVRWNI